MDGPTFEKALTRIEAALGRVEKAAAQPHTGDAELQARHERLRAAVSGSVRQLDELLAGREP